MGNQRSDLDQIPALDGGLRLAIDLDADGSHPAAWRRADHSPRALLDPQRLTDLVRRVESDGFTFAVFGDAVVPPEQWPGITARLDAVQRAAFAGPLTHRLGLVAQTEVLFAEPFHLATQLASLDFAAQGRGGWSVAAVSDQQRAAAYGRTEASLDQIRREAADVVDVGRRLWDSWEDDAVIRDAATGRYLDGAKLHHVDFVGDSFSVRGPLITPRPPQGQLPVFLPWGLVDPGAADVVIINGRDVTELRRLAERAKASGAPRVVGGIEVLLDLPEIAADQRLAELDDQTRWEPSECLRYVGSAAGLADLLSELAEGLDGVIVSAAVLDEDLPELERAVLPRLSEIGLIFTPESGSSLRDAFGLSRPASRYAALSA